MHDPGSPVPRPLRSFVRREGRLTRGQARALNALSAQYCISVATPGTSDPATAAFSRDAPLHLEIGCGAGDTLLALAQRHPEYNFLGMEVYRPGIGYLLQRLAAEHIDNVRLVVQDATVALEQSVPNGAVDAFYIFFPDPWPKKRHHKRRLVQPGFVKLLQRKLRTPGAVHLATDHAEYAQQMLQVFESNGFTNIAGAGRYASRPEWRPLTRYERRGLRLGHEVFDMSFSPSPDGPNSPAAR